MRQIKQLFSFVLTLALISGAAYGYAWYQAKTFIDRQIDASASQIKLSYQRLVIDPRGTLRLEQIQIQPEGYNSVIEIGSLSLHSDDPLFFFDPQGRIDKGEFPAFLSLGLSDVTTDMGADFLAAMEPSAADLLLHPQPVDLEALACADERQFSAAAMRRMGIGRVVTDFAVTLQANNDRGSLALLTEVDSSGLFAIDTNLELSFSAGYLKPDTLAAANPRLKSVQVDYQDLGFYAKRDKYCAGASGLSEEAYREEHLRMAQVRAQQLGMQVPQLIWDAYLGSTSRGAAVSFGATPIGGLGPEVMLELNSPQGLIERLRLRWNVGARPVDLTQVDWLTMLPDPQASLSDVAKGDQSEVSASNAGRDANTEIGNTAEVAPEQPSSYAIAPKDDSDNERVLSRLGMPIKPLAAPEKRFRKTDFSQLAQYIYSDIRIYTYYGNRVEGRLEAVEGDNIKILHRVGQGMAVYPVDRAKLDVIEVMR